MTDATSASDTTTKTDSTATTTTSATGRTGDTGAAPTTKITDTGMQTATTSTTDITKKTGNTILDGNGTGTETVPPADWPADWRTKMAGEDKKLLAQLERFGSPVDMAKKIREQDALISSGKLKAALPKDATPEQITAYRKENNIPEAPDKYDLTLPDGLIVGEADKPIVNNMLTAMHGMNLNNDQVKQILSSYYAQEKTFLQQREIDIEENKKTQDDQLHQEWGAEYRANVNIINSLVKTYSEETRNALAGALDSNGMPLLNNAAFLRDLAVQARTINPIDTVVNGGGGNQMSSVEDEIKQIEARMGGADPTYYKDEKAQARYRQLVEWREKNKKVA